MNKRKFKGREYTFLSEKNNGPITVIGDSSRLVALELEADDNVVSYQVNIPLEFPMNLSCVTGIRKSYLEEQWVSDFLVTYLDGTEIIIETIKEEQLSKLSEVEKLELSKRYWTSQGIKWFVAVKKGNCNIYDAILEI